MKKIHSDNLAEGMFKGLEENKNDDLLVLSKEM